jgi:hypothetical protein
LPRELVFARELGFGVAATVTEAGVELATAGLWGELDVAGADGSCSEAVGDE